MNHKPTPNQIVAFNLRRLRGLYGWPQATAAERIQRYLGGKTWSKQNYSAAEKSEGDRVRQFSADELVAFSAAFNVPISGFLFVPEEIELIGTPEGQGLTRDALGALAGPRPVEREQEIRDEKEHRLESWGIPTVRVPATKPKEQS